VVAGVGPLVRQADQAPSGGRLSCAPCGGPARAGGKLECAVVRHSRYRLVTQTRLLTLPGSTATTNADTGSAGRRSSTTSHLLTNRKGPPHLRKSLTTKVTQELSADRLGRLLAVNHGPWRSALVGGTPGVPRRARPDLRHYPVRCVVELRQQVVRAHRLCLCLGLNQEGEAAVWSLEAAGDRLVEPPLLG
jgi:hypothetical protein